MNRVVLIGNGYDLSVGLKTRYEDFLVFYIKKCLTLARGGKDYNDGLIKISVDHNNLLFKYPFTGNPYDQVQDEIIDPINTISDFKKCGHIKFTYTKFSTSSSSDIIYKVDISNSLLSDLLINKGWTDIESTYFKKVLKLDIYNTKSISSVNKMNKQFDVLKKELKKYLNGEERLNYEEVEDINKTDKRRLLERCLLFNPESPENPFYEKEIKDDYINKVLFINFNYTSTLEVQLKQLLDSYGNHNTSMPSFKVESIHGNLEDNTDIIFGYGDENHDSYKSIEESEIAEYLVNIKSFYYSLNDKYRNILNFISEDEYEVFSIGHSLGISDRILLSTIMTNKNCRFIRLFHRGNKNSFFNKVISLSRHFPNNGDMRRKLLEYDGDDKI